MNKVIFFMTAMIFTLLSCNESGVKQEDQQQVSDTLQAAEEFNALDEAYSISLSQSALESVLRSIPSPLEFADDLVKHNIPFDEKNVAKLKNKDDLISEDDKAIATGIYGTDLSYINIFNEKFNALMYYKTVVSLAKDLRVEQFFNLATVEKLQANEGNSEKLLEIVRGGYKDIHSYLKKQNRSHLSTYMLYGSWLEAFYITLSIHDGQKFNLKENIGDQKITINKMRAIFSSLQKDNATTKRVLNELMELNKLCGAIDISYAYSGSEATNNEKEIDLIENQIKQIKIDDATIAKMRAKVTELRNSYTN